MGTSVVTLNNLVFLIGSQFYIDFLATVTDLTSVNPFTHKLEMIFFCNEGNCFIYAEHLKFYIIFVFLGFAQEEICNFFVELRYCFRWEVYLSG